MESKLKACFLPPNYIQNNYSLLLHLTQGSTSVEEYTREFEKLLIKCDLQETEEQTIVRYMGGLDPKYAHVVELQPFTTFHKVCPSPQGRTTNEILAIQERFCQACA